MNKSDLIDAMAEKAQISKAAAVRALDAALETIQDSVAANDPVRLIGFGTFELAPRKAKTGRNPKTGATLNIPASNLPKFKAGVAFKRKVASK